MALLFEKTGDNGVKTAYHRVTSFMPDFDKNRVQVTIRSYTAEDFRNSEKQHATNQVKIEELRSQINILVMDPTDDNEPDRIKLSDQLNELTESQTETGDLFVVEQKIELPVPADFTYDRADIYELVKQALFAGAKDC